MVRANILFFAVLVAALVCGKTVFANHFELMKSSVVKIRSKPPDGVAQIGTGFVVSVDDDTAYIVRSRPWNKETVAEFFSAKDYLGPKTMRSWHL